MQITFPLSKLKVNQRVRNNLTVYENVVIYENSQIPRVVVSVIKNFYFIPL